MFYSLKRKWRQLQYHYEYQANYCNEPCAHIAAYFQHKRGVK